MADETTFPASEFEGTTVEELATWANGLGVCSFAIIENDYDGKPIIRARSDKRVTLKLRLGRYSENALVGLCGKAAVFLSSVDQRNGGYSGCSGGYLTHDGLATSLRRQAEKLGISNGQLCLF